MPRKRSAQEALLALLDGLSDQPVEMVVAYLRAVKRLRDKCGAPGGIAWEPGSRAGRAVKAYDRAEARLIGEG